MSLCLLADTAKCAIVINSPAIIVPFFDLTTAEEEVAVLVKCSRFIYQDKPLHQLLQWRLSVGSHWH